ncbi:MAG: alpha-ketoglutarate-dependent dioxygenase AlkB, partial [Acinetobacter sp.]
MQLFDIEADPQHNYLPYDGTVQYWGKVISSLAADEYFAKLIH